MVFGVAIPDTPKAAPETVITEIVRSALPAFVKVTAEFLVAPVVTVPKFTLAGLMLNCGFGPTAIPVRGTAAVDVAPVESLNVSVSVPVIVPLALLVNDTLTLDVWPAASVNGRVTPEMENCVPDEVA